MGRNDIQLSKSKFPENPKGKGNSYQGGYRKGQDWARTGKTDDTISSLMAMPLT
jgi:hypothetical protein